MQKHTDPAAGYNYLHLSPLRLLRMLKSSQHWSSGKCNSTLQRQKEYPERTKVVNWTETAPSADTLECWNTAQEKQSHRTAAGTALNSQPTAKLQRITFPRVKNIWLQAAEGTSPRELLFAHDSKRSMRVLIDTLYTKREGCLELLVPSFLFKWDVFSPEHFLFPSWNQRCYCKW